MTSWSLLANGWKHNWIFKNLIEKYHNVLSNFATFFCRTEIISILDWMWFAGCRFYMPVVLFNLLCSWIWLWNSFPWRPADHVRNMGLMCNRWRFYKTHVQRSGGPLLKWNQHRLLAWLRSKDLGLRSPGRSWELYEALTLQLCIPF